MDAERAAYYLELARDAKPGLLGSDSAAWMKRLGDEYEGLVGCIQSCPDERSLEIASALLRFWMGSGRSAEGREIIVSALAAPHAQVPSAVRAESLYAAGLLAFLQGDNDVSRRLNEDSLEVARTVNSPERMAEALVGLARVALREGDYPAVRQFSEEGRHIAQSASLRAAEIWPLHLLAAVTQMEGDYDGARNLYRQSLCLNRHLGNAGLVALELGNLGFVELLDGRPECASPFLQEALTLARDQGNARQIPYCLMGVAGVAAEAGDSVEAATLLGAAQALLESGGVVLDPPDQPVFDLCMSAVRRDLDDQAFVTAWTAGRGLSLDTATARALAALKPHDS
ncbi:MAG: hypothetical protein PVSMB7_17890 [Chloroflexota bacterium]